VLLLNRDLLYFVYAVTSISSLVYLDELKSLLYTKRSGFKNIILVANKIDLEEVQVSRAQGLKKAMEWGCPFMEVSAKTGTNIDELFPVGCRLLWGINKSEI